MSTKRIEYFDALKGFAIILVVFCHHVVLNAESLLGNIVMSFTWAAVPCFFMVTGGLMHKAKTFSWKKWISRMLRVYICMAVWKFLYWMFYAVTSNVIVDARGIIKYLFLMGNVEGIDAGPIWFIVAYLQVISFYPITYQLYTKSNISYFVFLLAYTFTFTIFKSVASFIGLDMEPMLSLVSVVSVSGDMFFYFLLGVLLLHYRKEITEFFDEKAYKKYLPIVLILIGGIGAMFIKYSYTGTFRWAGIYLESGYTRISTMLMAVGLYLVFSQELICGKGTHLLSRLGKHTMGIFYLHYPVMLILKKIAFRIIPNLEEYYSFQLNLIQTILVVAICCGITVIAKKIPIIKHLFI